MTTRSGLFDEYADDKLRSIREIAEYLGATQRRTHYLCQNKMIPAYQIGSRWEMRRSTYLAHIAKLETA
jgi:excisionase family DNA binding protein